MMRLPPGLPSDQPRPAVLHEDRRRHRAEHALARRDGVGLAAEQAEHVRRARLGAEVVHLVVQQEAGASDDLPVAVRAVERRRGRRRRCRRHRRPSSASSPNARSRRGWPGLTRRLGVARVSEMPLRSDVGVAPRQQAGHRHAEEVRVAQPLGAIRVDAPLGLRHQMNRARRVVAVVAEREAFEDVEQLHQGDAAGARRRHRDDSIAAIRADDRRPLSRRVGRRGRLW